MDRRLQILPDEDRYARLAAESTDTGRSVAALIREAIDVRFATEVAHQRAAARRFLAHAAAIPGAGDQTSADRTEPDWRDTKEALEHDVSARWS